MASIKDLKIQIASSFLGRVEKTFLQKLLDIQGDYGTEISDLTNSLSEIKDNINVNSDEIDIISKGNSFVNKLQNAPYSYVGRDQNGNSSSSNTTQSIGSNGLTINTLVGTDSNITNITTDEKFGGKNLMTLEFRINALNSANPGIGIVHTNGTCYFLRSNGQVFDVAATGGGTTIYRNSGSGGFVVGDLVRMAFDFVNSNLTISVNGITQSTLTINSTIPIEGEFIKISLRGSISVIDTKVLLSSRISDQYSVFWVSKTGSDSNTGNRTNPFLTISKAIKNCIGKSTSKIIIDAGDYRESLDFTEVTFEEITLVSRQKAVVRILGSQQLTGWVKTSGFTNIYESTFTGTIPIWDHSALPSIFEDKNPSKPIPTNEISAFQKGLTNRLPYTQIRQIPAGANLTATLTTLDSSPGRYYFNANKVYIHASGSTSPLVNNFSYEIPVRPANITPLVSVTDAKGILRLNNLFFYFPTTGFVSSGFNYVERQACSIFGAISYGGWRDDAAFVLSYKDEAGGCANDGFNQHYDFYHTDYASHDVRRGVGVAIYFDPWAHDNEDDGMSCHQRSEVSIFGGLSEYNGDGGYVPANGGAYRCYNCIARGNVWNTDGTQAGFATANAATGSGRNVTTLEAHNCVSIGNKRNFQSGGGAGNTAVLVNPIARNATEFEYVVQDASVMRVWNGKVTSTDSLKYKSVLGTGVLEIINDSQLT